MDGVCVATTRVQDIHLHSPTGIKNHEPSHAVWTWQRLQIVNSGEVRASGSHSIHPQINMSLSLKSVIIIACASVDIPSLVPSLAVPDDETQEKTRLTAFEFLQNDADESNLQKVGEWYLDGRPETLELHRIHDSEYVDLSSLPGLINLYCRRSEVLSRLLRRSPP
jgi:hypothetical protein